MDFICESVMYMQIFNKINLSTKHTLKNKIFLWFSPFVQTQTGQTSMLNGQQNEIIVDTVYFLL
jgi:hypothetical protein